jgi:RNA polymerase sigma factor (sigma-70 family)
METIPITLRAELVACLHRVSSGDQGALEYLYKNTGGKLFGICKRILSDPIAAEDVLQEVFLTVWNKAGQFDPALGVSPITWLAAIARNRALDRLRATKQRFVMIEEAAELADSSPLADACLETHERSQRLKTCLDRLDERTATIIRNAFFGGITYQLLAKQAGMPLATVKSLVRRGLIQLKHCLEHD